ncbi:MAG: hypothetical protein IJ454_02485 [Clostridia bacterium]|nr:hypothetical protein [Clostridia bacterium]
MKKYLALLLAVVIALSCLAGCGDKDKEAATGGSSDVAVNELGNTVEDSSDLPDWEGKKLDLRMWWGQGTSSIAKNNKPTKDVVWPEIYRVTGVRFTEDSFDNGGELMDAKISKIIAANDWPDIVVNPEAAVLEKMIDADMVYDLTDLIPKYMPNLTKLIELGGDTPIFKSEREDGKLYYLITSAGANSVDYLDPDIDPALLARVKVPVEPIDYVYVRDDILTKLYPNAKTQDEIEELYMKNGKFTKEEILDVTFKSKEEFFDFLYDIKELGVKEGNREVYPFYVADGIDNWSLLAHMGSLYGYNMNKQSCNYFTYWDKETDQIEYMFKQPFFKQVLKDWTKLVQDDIASPDSLIDNRAAFEEKVNNGQYAVLYGQAVPDQNVMNAAGKPYKYRKVYIDIKPNSDKFLFSKTNSAGTAKFVILKNTIKEEDLPQVLRFFDFMISEAGQKLAYWGPRSAGLFTEENGVRKFVDKKLEAESVYDEPNEMKIYYNLESQAWPIYPTATSLHQPKLVYDFEPRKTMANKYFSMGTVEVPELTYSKAGNIWEFDTYGVEGVSKFWAARQSFENALTKIFIAKNDKEFESLYKEMIATAERNGLTDKTLKEINTAFKEINADYMDNLK